MNPKTAPRAATIVLLILILTLTTTIASASAPASDYSQFHHNPQRTGNVSGDAPLTDTLLWKTSPSAGYIGGGASIAGDRVYVSTWPPMGKSNNLGLFCMNKHTGEILWRNPLSEGGSASTPAVSGDRVFVGSCTGDLYCANTTDGIAVWNITIDENPSYWGVASSPLIYNDTVFVNSFSDAKLHAFDFNGDELWEIDTPGNIDHYASPAAECGMVFFAGGNPALYCVNISDHSILWRFNTSDMIKTTPTIADGVVFFATKKRMYALDMAGDELWRRDLGSTISSPAISHGRVYIGSSTLEKKLYCFDATDGSEIWNKSVDGAILSSPVVACETVYFGTNAGDGTVYALNATDGTVRWSYDTGDYIMSPPSVSDGTMFIGSDTGYLYAFGTPEAFWNGSVVLLKGETLNVTANNGGTNYTINCTTALGAFVKAAGARYGDFNFTINDSDYAANGSLFVDSVAGLSNDETEGTGWHYRVNNDLDPAISANTYELNAASDARDVVTFYYGNSAVVPENSTTVIAITTQIIAEKPEAIIISVERHDFIESASVESNLNITLLHPSEVESEIDLTGYDLIFLEHIGGSAATNLMEPVAAANDAGIPIISIHSEGYDQIFGNVNLTGHPLILKYWDNYDRENIARLLTYLEINFCGLIGDVKDPIPSPKAYIYHPDATKLFLNTTEYIEWYSGETRVGYRYSPDNLTIGIAAWHESTRSPDIRALIHTLEQKGANVILIGFVGTNHIKRFYIVNNSTIVDAIICTKSFRINLADSAQGIRDLETLNVPVMRAVRLYYMNADAWRNETSHGISIMDLGFQVGLPELDGIIDPIVIAGKNISETEYQPIDDQINWMSDRAISWARLCHIPDIERRVAMIYYNHGGGKDNIGACYVNVPPSLRNILDSMKEAGYNVTGEIPDEKVLIDLMMHEGTNVGTWAPGELNKMVAAGNVTLVSVDSYIEWFGELEKPRQDEVVERWGEPPGEIMTWENETTGDAYFVFPKLSFGNVILTPQPTRGWLQNNTVLYHNRDVPPHHQYIAFYLWLGQEQESGGFGADAIIHFGKHGTQEWLPGKESGLSQRDCWPAILIQDLPVIYPYIVDNIAEGTQAKRRGSATMITHLTPPIIASGLYGNLTNLIQTISDYELAHENTTVADEYKAQIISLYHELHLEDALKFNLTESPEIVENETLFCEFTDEIADYLYDIKMSNIPYGLHTFGDPPTGDPMVLMVGSMLRDVYRREVGAMIGYFGYPDPTQVANESRLDNCTKELLKLVLKNDTTPVEAQMAVFGVNDSDVSENITVLLERAIRFEENITACDIEVPRTLAGLNGSYIPPSSADDPIRDPDALPTGRNFHSLNPDRIPTAAAYKTGTEMAEKLVERYRVDHNGAYPRKFEIILWAWCTTDGGVVESEILRLVGAKPLRDEYDKVIDVELIPVSELERPRIDVVVVPSGLERDFSPKSLKFIDRAIRLAATANDTYPNGTAYPNYVKENSEAIYHWLVTNTNYTDSEARYFSMSRIFLEAPGTYGPNLDSALSASGTWTNDSAIGELFIKRMNYIYGDDVWGVPGIDIFEINLADVDSIVHNMNSNLYGLLDNDDVVQYVGGSACAIRTLTGETPGAYITDNRDTDSVVVNSLEERFTQEIYARYANPTWLEGMIGEGYAGAREMMKFMEHLGMWDYTMPDLVTDSMWQQAYDIYAADIYDLGLSDFFDENNPYAYQSMTGRMLEMVRKGYWNPSDDVLKTLVSDYVESIVENGVTCCHHTCGNPLLDKFVSGIMSMPGVVSDEDFATYREIMDAVKMVQDAAGQSGNSGGRSGTGTYPPEWENQEDQSESSSSSRTNETITEGGVGTDANQPEGKASLSEPSDYVEGTEMEVETQEKFTTQVSFSGAPMIGLILVILLAAVIYWGYRRRE